MPIKRLPAGQERDLLSSRQNLLQQQTQLRWHIHTLLRRNGLHYKDQPRTETHWTKQYYRWLDRIIDAASGSFKVKLELLVSQLKGLNATLTVYDRRIEPNMSNGSKSLPRHSDTRC